MKNLLALLTLLASFGVNAAQWSSAFVLTGVFVSAEGNYHLRANGLPAAANCPGSWAYINQSDSGSKEYMASLLLAYALGKQVSLYVAPDTNGYCHIIELQVSG